MENKDFLYPAYLFTIFISNSLSLEMGCSSSRTASTPKPPTRRLSSLVCGSSSASSSSRSPFAIENCLQKSPVSSIENLAPVSDESRSSIAESSTIFTSKPGFSCSKTETGSSSESSNSTIEDSFMEQEESVSHQVSVDCNCKDTASTSYTELPSQELDSSNARIECGPLICLEDTHSSNVNLDGDSVENPVGSEDSDSGSLLVVSDSVANIQSGGEEDLRTGGVLHVDVVSISSNILSSNVSDISNREARRNSRRLFWDALSRRSFRRYIDSPTIVFTTGHADDLGSHDRWLLDLSGDLHYDGVGRGFSYAANRRHQRTEQRRQLRSEISESILGGLDEQDQRTTFCASGLHPDGTCTCESPFMGEEFSTVATISRIVMLAEALFEALDEIHRQPLSLSLSMLSLPAPESVVDAFPLKNHKKIDAAASGPDDVQQCYICLAEYEEGDKLRVLPCHHEYHMSCVDKWLKEINGVCPVCRCNVCEGEAQSSTSNTQLPSQ